MKISTIITATIAAVLFTSCLSLGSDSFSSSKQILSGNMIISTDEFAGTTFAEHKYIGVDFTSRKGLVSAGFYIEPVFSVEDDCAVCFLRIKTSELGISSLSCSKIILLGDSGKVTINTKSTPEIETERGFNTTTYTTYLEELSMADYEKLTDFISNSQSMRMGFYTENNKAIELKEYENRARRIFSDAYSYYKINIQGKTDTAVHANQLIWN